MKNLFLFLIFLAGIGVTPSTAQSKQAAKAAAEEQAFNTVKALVDNGYFCISINRVYPQSGRDVSRFNPQGNIVIEDTIARGQLPFFGRAYQLPYGEGGGIEFDGPMKDRKLKIIRKRKYKIISYAFSVNAQNDTYHFTIDISSNGNCHVHLISNNRTQISYSGEIGTIPEPGEKPRS